MALDQVTVAVCEPPDTFVSRQIEQVSVLLFRNTDCVKFVVPSSCTDVIVRVPPLSNPAIPIARLLPPVIVMLPVVLVVVEVLWLVTVVCTCATAAWRTAPNGIRSESARPSVRSARLLIGALVFHR